MENAVCTKYVDFETTVRFMDCINDMKKVRLCKIVLVKKPGRGQNVKKVQKLSKITNSVAGDAAL